jgi:hypothetical protein
MWQALCAGAILLERITSTEQDRQLPTILETRKKMCCSEKRTITMIRWSGNLRSKRRGLNTSILHGNSPYQSTKTGIPTVRDWIRAP